MRFMIWFCIEANCNFIVDGCVLFFLDKCCHKQSLFMAFLHVCTRMSCGVWHCHWASSPWFFKDNGAFVFSGGQCKKTRLLDTKDAGTVILHLVGMRRHMAEDLNVRQCHCESLKFWIVYLLSQENWHKYWVTVSVSCTFISQYTFTEILLLTS